jgi:hypothetical protein
VFGAAVNVGRTSHTPDDSENPECPCSGVFGVIADFAGHRHVRGDAARWFSTVMLDGRRDGVCHVVI